MGRNGGTTMLLNDYSLWDMAYLDCSLAALAGVVNSIPFIACKISREV